MVIAGFRPDRRSTFVSAKVDKAIDTQFGHIGWVGRAEEERTNSLRSNKARRKQRASDPRAEQQASEFRMERQIYKKQVLEVILNDCRVVAAARNREKRANLSADLGIQHFVLDATISEQVKQCVNQIAERYGRIDGLVNCVGTLLLKPAHLTSDKK
jgi:short-subunit dehydrogenase involved in D-alanine esterification of teichoic acids